MPMLQPIFRCVVTSPSAALQPLPVASRLFGSAARAMPQSTLPKDRARMSPEPQHVQQSQELPWRKCIQPLEKNKKKNPQNPYAKPHKFTEMVLLCVLSWGCARKFLYMRWHLRDVVQAEHGLYLASCLDLGCVPFYRNEKYFRDSRQHIRKEDV